MKVEIEDGRLIVTPITEEDSRIIYALAAAYAAFENGEHHDSTRQRLCSSQRPRASAGAV